MGHQNMNRSTTGDIMGKGLYLTSVGSSKDVQRYMIYIICWYWRAIFSAKDQAEWNSEFRLWCLEFPVGSIIRSLKFWWYAQFFANFQRVCNENILMTYLLEISPLNFVVKISCQQCCIPISPGGKAQQEAWSSGIGDGEGFRNCGLGTSLSSWRLIYSVNLGYPFYIPCPLRLIYWLKKSWLPIQKIYPMADRRNGCYTLPNVMSESSGAFSKCLVIFQE